MKKWMAALLLLAVSVFPQQSAEAARSVRLPVLMYHQVSQCPERLGAYTVSLETLRGDLEYLKKNGYETVSMQMLMDYAAGRGDLPPKPVMLTFDDGQRSVAEYAVPLLEEMDMCAVLAIVGQFADLYTENGDTNIHYSCLSWPELRQLNQNPHVELAVHTYAMHSVSPRPGCSRKRGESDAEYQAALEEDTGRAEARFLQYLGEVPAGYVYPFGLYCETTRRLLAQRGYQVLFTCEEHVNLLTGKPEELLQLGRYNRPEGADRAAFFKRWE